MSVRDRLFITPDQLISACNEIKRLYPDAKLVRNEVGNLSVFNGDDWIGYIDLGLAEFHSD